MAHNDEVGEESPCKLFCLWTHLHGWRHFALSKNKGYWAFWIVILVLFSVMSFWDIYAQVHRFASGATSIWTRYALIRVIFIVSNSKIR